MNSQPRGQIITFYSYKGGTGRTMSLANIACVLAGLQQKGKGVLMIDWDLEAPGLHLFFQNKLLKERGISEEKYKKEPGLIDLFHALKEKTDVFLPKAKEFDSKEDLAQKIVKSINFTKYISPTGIENLSLMKAGCFMSNDKNEYPERVHEFDWKDFYTKLQPLIRVFADKLAEDYDYVLIDSRTGITDISGICTMLLPEKLVVVFTPNTQSIDGAIDAMGRATDYRKESTDSRPLIVFPLVSRVESLEPVLRRVWRYGGVGDRIRWRGSDHMMQRENEGENVIGFQPEFEKKLAEIYNEKKVDLQDYFNEMQVQHIPRYAYGEKIAILDEGLDDRFSLRIGYKTFTNKLIENLFPWEGSIVHPPGEKEEIYPEEMYTEEEIALKEKMSRLGFTSKWLLRLVGIDFNKTTQTVLASIAIIITILGFESLLLYRQIKADLETARQQNTELQQQIIDLEKLRPSLDEKDKTIQAKEATINELYGQINASGSDKDKTILLLQQQLNTANGSSQIYQERSGKYLQRALYAETENADLKATNEELRQYLADCKK